MVTVEVPVPADDVSTPMRTMRQWLDDIGFDASSFAWIETDGRTVVRVKFKINEEAVAFAEHFAGRVVTGRLAAASAQHKELAMAPSSLATRASRDDQLKVLADHARVLANLVDVLFEPTVKALEAAGWSRGDCLRSADLRRAADCAERAMKEGGVFIPG